MPDWRRYVQKNLNLGRSDAVEEIARQLEDAYLEALNEGLPPEEAEQQAKLHIADWEKLSTEASRVHWLDSLESSIRDGRYAARRLRRSLGFSVVAVMTLGLGIGANTVIFSAINSLLLNPGGLTDAKRVLAIQVNYEKLNRKYGTVNTAEFLDVQDSKDVFAASALGTMANFNYAGGDFPERIQGQRVTWQWFELFGVKPLLGRVFTAAEDQPNGNGVVVLEYGLWKRLFGGDASVIDRTIELNQQPYKVIGVMGPEFLHRPGVSLWTPLGLPLAAYNPRTRFNGQYDLFARVRSDVSLEQVNARIRLLTGRVHQDGGFAGEYARNNGWSLVARPYAEVMAGDLKSPMFVLMGAVGFVLLIACANIAGLMMARAAGQTRELAVRVALGAGRWRLVRQALAESTLIAAAGLVTGVLMASGGLRLLTAFAPGNLSGFDIQLDANVMGFTALIGIAAGVVFGVIPALQITGGQNMEPLKEGGRFGTATRRQLRFRSVLVTLEIALALVLLVGAGLFLRTLANLEKVDTGFDSKGVMTGMVALAAPGYSDLAKQHTFHRALLEGLAAIPGVTHAATGLPVPFIDDAGGGFVIDGETPQPGGPSHTGRLQFVSHGYFETLGIPLVRGRTFTDQDDPNSEPVVIIDENLARQYWPNEDPVGKRIRRTAANAPLTRIVGVVRHVRHSELGADSGIGSHYYPVYQTSQVRMFAVLVKTTLEPAQVTNAIRDAVRAVDPGQAVFDLRTMEDRVLGSLGARRFAVQLMTGFGVLGVLMAAVGLYGLVSYIVAQRTHEIGVRMALGAGSREILALVIRSGMRMAIAGIVLGSIGAFMLARLLSSHLFQVPTFDPATFALTAAAVGIVALLACLLPARRAMSVDPLGACRWE